MQKIVNQRWNDPNRRVKLRLKCIVMHFSSNITTIGKAVQCYISLLTSNVHALCVVLVIKLKRQQKMLGRGASIIAYRRKTGTDLHYHPIVTSLRKKKWLSDCVESLHAIKTCGASGQFHTSLIHCHTFLSIFLLSLFLRPFPLLAFFISCFVSSRLSLLSWLSSPAFSFFHPLGFLPPRWSGMQAHLQDPPV